MESSTRFLEFAIRSGALWLSGTPTKKLKSGRMSPYFFNSAGFSTGETMTRLGTAYAGAILDAELNPGVIFGPAYKGISLALGTTLALWNHFGVEVGWAHDRKEEKNHGDGGMIVGAKLDGQRVVIVDDVIMTGWTKDEAYELVRSFRGEPVAIVIAFDRQERGAQSSLSAVQETQRKLGIPVIAAATTTDLLAYLEKRGTHKVEVAAIKAYQTEYGANL